MRLFRMWVPFSCELQMRGNIIRQNEARDKYSRSAALATRVDGRKGDESAEGSGSAARTAPPRLGTSAVPTYLATSPRNGWPAPSDRDLQAIFGSNSWNGTSWKNRPSDAHADSSRGSRAPRRGDRA